MSPKLPPLSSPERRAQSDAPVPAPEQMPAPASEDWGDLWRDTSDTAASSSSKPLLDHIRRRAQRQARHLRWWAIGDIVTAAGLTLYGAWHLWSHSTGPDVVIVLFIWVLVLAATAFSFWNRRGLWRSQGETASAYLALIRLRLRRRVKSARFALYLLLVEVVLVYPWLYWAMREDARRLTDSPKYWGAMGALIGGMLLFLAGYRFWLGRQLREVERMMGEVAQPPD